MGGGGGRGCVFKFNAMALCHGVSIKTGDVEEEAGVKNINVDYKWPQSLKRIDGKNIR